MKRSCSKLFLALLAAGPAITCQHVASATHSGQEAVASAGPSGRVSFAAAATHDWPQWLGDQRDGVWREDGIIDALPAAGPPVKWRLAIGPGYSGPSVADGRVFVMDRTAAEGLTEEEIAAMKKAGQVPGGERLLCLDQQSGQVLWQHTWDCPYRIAYPSGPRCTPTVDGDRVYALGAMGDLFCLQTADGKLLWHQRFPEIATRDGQPAKPPVWGYASHPVIDGPRIVVPVGGDGSAVIAFDKLTGQEVWRSLSSSDIAYAPLVFWGDGAGRQLIFWHADGIDSVNPETGAPYWHHTWPEEQTQPGATTSIATPVFIGDRLYLTEYFAGSLLLRLKADPPGVEELDRSAARDPRHRHSMNSLMTNPVIREGHVYCVTGDGILRCVRLDDGEMVWEDPAFMGGKKPEDFATLFQVEHEGRYFCLDDQGRLSIVSYSPAGRTVHSSCQLIKATQNARGRTVVWSHPAFAGRCIFARNDEEIICFDMADHAAGSRP